MKSRLTDELERFRRHKQRCLEKYPHALDIDEFGFAMPDAEGRIDILFIGLTHGNEVIGIEILNLLSDKFVLHNNFCYGFLLNNVAAYREEKRLLDRDLNRCFGHEGAGGREPVRASEVQHILTRLRPRLILDLHQTSEASLGPFSFVPEDPRLMAIARGISQTYPVVTFPLSGFSSEGKTLVEYARGLGIPALVFEIGEKGFNAGLALEFQQLLAGINLQKVLESTPNSEEISHYFHINRSIPNEKAFTLVPGLKNLEAVRKGQVLATNPEGLNYVCEEDALMIFPRYTNIRKEEPVLGSLAVRKK